jgi:hypothetical protein
MKEGKPESEKSGDNNPDSDSDNNNNNNNNTGLQFAFCPLQKEMALHNSLHAYIPTYMMHTFIGIRMRTRIYQCF